MKMKPSRYGGVNRAIQRSINYNLVYAIVKRGQHNKEIEFKSSGYKDEKLNTLINWLIVATIVLYIIF